MIDTDGKIELAGLTSEELKEFVLSLGESAFRSKQISAWIKQGAQIDEMTNLSKSLREKLAKASYVHGVEITRSIVSKLDGTEKYLYTLRDGNIIEGVRMRYHYGDTLCVSTQVGCRMGCRFCASTLEGCVRNLTAGEILGQLLAVNRHIQKLEGESAHIHNIVLMGSGEPLDNYDEVIRFLRLVNAPEGMNISLRNISLSTCGIVPKLYSLADEQLPVTLSISMHAPNDAIRKQLMPIANAYTVDEVLKACRYYIDKTGRRVIFEYALVKGVNCSEADADELSSRLRGLQCHVNVIPLNSVQERDLSGPDEETIKAFIKRLEIRHISATRRREMGDDIQGACGQLRRSYLKEADV
ncbi:MAG: 23S rRNA (adenine(2503)-C(2))-methyltransferase RlmN [Clostridia bacterium]|nr:23S rRNA (adenine(2503)-C(2))-methyltransferase RlmN [Clostridia bacterium]